MAGAQQNEEEEIVAINVTPLVDITLVLLIIFMVTASFIVRETVEVDMPRPAAQDTKLPGLVNIVMDRDSKLFFDGAQITEAELKPRIVEALKNDKETRAIITADQVINYGQVVALIDAVKGYGIAKFALNIQKSADPAATPAPAPDPAPAPAPAVP